MTTQPKIKRLRRRDAARQFTLHVRPTLRMRSKVGGKSGQISRLCVASYWAALFMTNEMLRPSRRMTDDQLADAFAREFPSARHGYYTVNKWRNRYNRGKLTGGEIPDPQSRRYDDHGNAVDGRTGKRILERANNGTTTSQ